MMTLSAMDWRNGQKPQKKNKNIENNWLVVFNHLEKYESQWEGLSHTLWKIKNVPNHQADYGSITRKVG